MCCVQPKTFCLPRPFLPALDKAMAAQLFFGFPLKIQSFHCGISQERMKLSGAEDGDLILGTNLL